MIRAKLPASAAVLSLILGGCQTYPVTLTRLGPQQRATPFLSQVNSFWASWELAYQTVPTLAKDGTPLPDQVTGNNAVAANQQYLSSGFSMVDTSCKDYFREAGKLQQSVNVFRDVANAFVPVTSGALSLASGNSEASAILSLAKSGADGILNTVYANFLFDSSNIDDVQTLVIAALSAHELKVRSNLAEAPSKINYEWVTDQILDHQRICQPAHILSLARAAISAGTVVASNSGTAAQQDGSEPNGRTLAPSVRITVANPGAAAPKPDVTYSAALDAATWSLTQCLFPGSRRGPHGEPLDAKGNPATPDMQKWRSLETWMKDHDYPNMGVPLFLDSSGTAKDRALAFKSICVS